MTHHSITPVRIKYPHPVPAREGTYVYTLAHGTTLEEKYCVGGGLCQYFHITHAGFPTLDVLSKALQQINPRLSWQKAERYAAHIIRSNDARRMQRAWMFAQAALWYGRKADKPWTTS